MLYQSDASFELHNSLLNYCCHFEGEEFKLVSKEEFEGLIQLITNTMAIETSRNETPNINAEIVRDNDYTLKTILEVISQTLNTRILKIKAMEDHYSKRENEEGNKEFYYNLRQENEDLIIELVLMLIRSLSNDKLFELSSNIDKLLIERL